MFLAVLLHVARGIHIVLIATRDSELLAITRMFFLKIENAENRIITNRPGLLSVRVIGKGEQRVVYDQNGKRLCNSIELRSIAILSNSEIDTDVVVVDVANRTPLRVVNFSSVAGGVII